MRRIQNLLCRLVTFVADMFVLPLWLVFFYFVPIKMVADVVFDAAWAGYAEWDYIVGLGCGVGATGIMFASRPCLIRRERLAMIKRIRAVVLAMPAQELVMVIKTADGAVTIRATPHREGLAFGILGKNTIMLFVDEDLDGVAEGFTGDFPLEPPKFNRNDFDELKAHVEQLRSIADGAVIQVNRKDPQLQSGFAQLLYNMHKQLG